MVNSTLIGECFIAAPGGGDLASPERHDSSPAEIVRILAKLAAHSPRILRKSSCPSEPHFQASMVVSLVLGKQQP
jgi:hypothetical protein